jgi:hypothetical protein
MSDAVVVALIATCPPTLLAAAALWKVHQGNRTTESIETKADKIETKVGEVKTNVDGRYSELLQALLVLTKSSSFHDGQEAGRQEEKDKRP